MISDEDAKRVKEAFIHMDEGHLDSLIDVTGELLDEQERLKKNKSSTIPAKQETNMGGGWMKADQALTREQREKLWHQLQNKQRKTP